MNNWQDFFDRHAPRYNENSFTKNTLVEVQFLWEAMKLAPGMRLLDVGCGTGRHSAEFARRGLCVTGLDFSAGMLEQAKATGADVEWIHADATQWVADEPYDAAICICEGGLGLIGSDEDALQHDLAILRNVGQSLKPGGTFVMTALNAYAQIRRMTDEDVARGTFNPATMVAQYKDLMELPEGNVEVHVRERLFIPPEMLALLHHAGFDVRHVWGGTAGEWGQRPLKLDEIEAMYVSVKR